MVKTVLFVCVHNAGRSQMAEGFLRAMARERDLDLVSESAGTLGGGSLNLVAVEAMKEAGVPMDGQYPKTLTQDMVDRADLIVSMGCGVDAEACPAKFLVTEDWGLDDPAGQTIEAIRPIRDEIKKRVSELLDRIEVGTV